MDNTNKAPWITNPYDPRVSKQQNNYDPRNYNSNTRMPHNYDYRNINPPPPPPSVIRNSIRPPYGNNLGLPQMHQSYGQNNSSGAMRPIVANTGHNRNYVGGSNAGNNSYTNNLINASHNIQNNYRYGNNMSTNNVPSVGHNSRRRNTPINDLIRAPVDPAYKVDGTILLRQHLPFLEFEDNVFYEIKETILPPQILNGGLDKPACDRNPAAMVKLVYTTNYDIKKVIEEKLFVSNDNVTFEMQIIMRIGVMDWAALQKSNFEIERHPKLKDCLPAHLAVFLNDSPVQLHGILPSNKPHLDGRRHPKPIEITHHTSLPSEVGPISQNSLSLKWTVMPNEYKVFVVGIYFARKTPLPELVQRFSLNKVMPEAKVRSSIIQRLKSDDDDDILADDIPVRILCPITNKLINVPVKGANCTHLQCFDFLSYLQMNDQKQTWRCPVCRNETTPSSIVVDGYMVNILKNPRIDPDLEKILFKATGDWIIDVKKEGDGYSSGSSSPQTNMSAVAAPSCQQAKQDFFINLCDSEDEEVDLKKKEEGTTLPPPPSVLQQPLKAKDETVPILKTTSVSKTAFQPEVIDLISSDEEPQEISPSLPVVTAVTSVASVGGLNRPTEQKTKVPDPVTNKDNAIIVPSQSSTNSLPLQSDPKKRKISEHNKFTAPKISIDFVTFIGKETIQYARFSGSNSLNGSANSPLSSNLNSNSNNNNSNIIGTVNGGTGKASKRRNKRVQRKEGRRLCM